MFCVWRIHQSELLHCRDAAKQWACHEHCQIKLLHGPDILYHQLSHEGRSACHHHGRKQLTVVIISTYFISLCFRCFYVRTVSLRACWIFFFFAASWFRGSSSLCSYLEHLVVNTERIKVKSEPCHYRTRKEALLLLKCLEPFFFVMLNMSDCFGFVLYHNFTVSSQKKDDMT